MPARSTRCVAGGSARDYGCAVHRATLNRRLGVAGLIALLVTALLVTSYVGAQSPPQSPRTPGLAPPGTPEWGVDVNSGTMVLSPPTARLALGLSAAESALHIVDGSHNVTQAPGTGYLILGQTDLVHMQFDRNDIRVAGPTDSAVGDLHLQRFGGPIVVHGAEPLDSRVYITADGSVGIATANPRLFAIDRELIDPEWPEPPGALAVDGDVYSERVRTVRLDVLDRLRIGRPLNPSVLGAANDNLHADAKLHVGGKVSAQQIVVHINGWADDVFDSDYELMPIDELEAYVQRERHLPGVPPQADVERDGIDLAQTNELLLRKVEELTLHAIDQQKKMLEQQQKIEELERRIDALAD
jgi:hypothetical protein